MGAQARRFQPMYSNSRIVKKVVAVFNCYAARAGIAERVPPNTI